MTEICLFAGTTEGRRLAEFLAKQDVRLTVCVATGYGGQLLNPAENITLIEKRLSAEEMRKLFSEKHFDLVIDATHPYAALVTENIAAACAGTDTPWRRLLRNGSDIHDGIVIVPDTASAAVFLEQTEGHILLTTGSKELAEFTTLTDFPERVYARVLPLQTSLEACSEAGLKPSHILAMQGPFSEDMNRAMLRSVNAEWLVTKDSGDAGGFDAKISAAQKENVRVLVIGRPPQKDGLSESEMISFLCEEYGFRVKPEVKIVGIGPGNREMMTLEAIHAIEHADCLIGAGRMLRSAAGPAVRTYEAVSEQTIADFIHTHHEFSSFAVLMSGDTSFFSGTKRLLPLLTGCAVEVLPGISSLSILCAKLNRSCEGIHPVSLHGRRHDIIPDVRQNSCLFILTGGENTAGSICARLARNGYGQVRVTVGEQLSYPDEKITCGRADELADGNYAPLSVMLIENDAPDMTVTHGLPDDAFLRDTGEKGLIPMTKSEIRSVCLSKLRLTERSVCWDIGSGTGSVAIEMALQAKKGHVYAIEQDEAAAKLIRRNSELLHAENLTVISGKAPEACWELPVPTHVFIGGSSGNLREIIRGLSTYKTPIRITATAVSLNAAAELTDIMASFPFRDTEAVLVQTSRAKKAGAYQLMMGGNPVYIFTMCLSGEE